MSFSETLLHQHSNLSITLLDEYSTPPSNESHPRRMRLYFTIDRGRKGKRIKKERKYTIDGSPIGEFSIKVYGMNIIN